MFSRVLKALAKKRGDDLRRMSLEEQDVLWEEAKRLEGEHHARAAEIKDPEEAFDKEKEWNEETDCLLEWGKTYVKAMIDTNHAPKK